MGYSERAFTGLELGSNKLGKGASRGGAVGVGGGGMGLGTGDPAKKQ